MGKTTLVNYVCDALRDDILHLRIKPGEQLNELPLREKLGVSRSPLREAFRVLEGEGLIEKHSHRGAYVREIQPIDIIELFPIRGVLEGLAARLAAPRLTDKELKQLETITDDMERATEKKDIRTYVKLNSKFHRAIVQAARNKKLEEMVKNLDQQSAWFILASTYYNKSLQYAMSSHRSIFEALKAGNGDLACRRLMNHIDDGMQKLLRIFT
jgi:DNA-binding GntR family transcriptional regulator